MLVMPVLWGCATESRAVQLRNSMRIQHSGTWSQQWAEAQAGSERAARRLQLCFAFRENADLAQSVALRPAEIEATCSADVKAIGADERATPLAYELAQRWAIEVLHDPSLGNALLCSSAKAQPGDAAIALRCADTMISDGRWSVAATHLRAAFDHGSEKQRCEVIRRIDQFSPSAVSDASSFSPEIVRTCRIALGAGQTSGGALPTPHTNLKTEGGADAMAPQPSGASTEPLEAGFEGRGGLSASSAGGLVGVEFGYGTSRLAVTLAPTLTFGAAQSTVTATMLGLSAAARLYLTERRPGLLVGYFRPEASLGLAAATAVDIAAAEAFFSFGAGVGCEYLFNSHFGVSGDLNLRIVAAPAFMMNTVASVGIVLHQ